MQTQPKSTKENQNKPEEKPDLPDPKPPTGRLARALNIGLALAGLFLYVLYITKGADFYSYFPGGRKLLFGLTGLIFGLLLYLRLTINDLRLRYFRSITLKNIQSSIVNRQSSILLAFIVLLAFGVRLWGVNFGLPYLEQVDEWNVAERALNIVKTGSFDPFDYRHPPLPENDRQAFTYPSLFTYLQTGLFSLRFLYGVAGGKYDGTSVLDSPLAKAEFYEWGRGLTALLGAGTVLLVYFVGRRFYGPKVGLLASLFLGFFYLHALNSHWLTTDVPSGFFALLPFFFIYAITEGSERKRDYLLAGLLCGLAMGSKYNNLLVLLPLVLAHFMGREPRKWLNWNLPLAFGAAFAGFFVSSPFIFFHFPNFLNDLAAIIDHYQNQGHTGFEGSDNWRYYIGAMWNENAAAVALGLAGVLLAFARHGRRDIILLSFPVLSYIQLSSYKVNFTRNLMPIIPFLTIFAGLALVWLVETLLKPKNWRRWQNPALAAIGLFCIVTPALTILQYDRYNAQLTNRARATSWVQQNLPSGSKIWIEPFSVELLPRSSYRVEGGKGVLTNPPEWYAANGYNYLVLSEAYYKEAYETGKPAIKDAYRALLEGPRPAGMQLVQDFPKNNSDRPGPRVIILSTNLPTVANSPNAYKISKPLQIDFNGKIKLIGADWPDKLKPGSTIPLTFYWQSLAPVSQNYTTFIHLLDANGKIVAQLDLPPLSGTRPTSIWKAGETVRDEYPLTLPADLPPGEYRLNLGLYLPANGARLPLAAGRDEAEVGRLRVEK